MGEMERLARRAKEVLESIPDDRLHTQVLDLFSRVGGGALPQQALPSKGVGIRIDGIPENEIERQLRCQTPAVIGRIENGIFMMDMRTVEADDLAYLKTAFETLLDRGPQ
jgi:L-seryl-tRNA(Ser) seleniumtransferase